MLRFSLGKTRLDRVCNEEIHGIHLSEKLVGAHVSAGESGAESETNDGQ